MAQIVRVAALQLNVVVDLVDHHLQLTGVDRFADHHEGGCGRTRKVRTVEGEHRLARYLEPWRNRLRPWSSAVRPWPWSSPKPRRARCRYRSFFRRAQAHCLPLSEVRSPSKYSKMTAVRPSRRHLGTEAGHLLVGDGKPAASEFQAADVGEHLVHQRA